MWSLVGVGDIHGECVFRPKTTSIGRADADRIAIFNFVIENGGGAQFASDDVKAAIVRIAGAGDQAITERVGRVHIRARECADGSARSGILRDGVGAEG